MKRIIRSIFVAILILLGIAVLLYPEMSNWLAVRSQDTTIRLYESAVEGMTEEEIAQQWALAQAYNEKHSSYTFSDPFGDGSAKLSEEYLSVLNFDGVMGYVDIPNINVYIPIYHGTFEEVIRKGAGHLPGSNLPVGGEGNHTVLTSHSGLASAKLFTDLENLEKGDRFYIHVLDEIMAYEVDQILITLPDKFDSLQAVEGKDYATLITCTPYSINSHRLIVRGVRVPMDEDEATRNPAGVNSSQILFYIAALVLGLVDILIMAIIHRRRRRKKHSKT